MTEWVYGGEWVVSSLLDDRAERMGDRIALESRSGSFTFGSLRDSAQRFGGALMAMGVRPGDRVATMLDTSLEYATAWWGIVWIGAIDVPVNTQLKGLFLEHILRDSGASVLVVDARWLARVSAVELPDLVHIIVVGEGHDAEDSAATVHHLDDALEASPAARVPRDVSDLVYIIYTSGTTGPSKGVMHSNESALWYVHPFVEQLELTEADVVYANFPLFHQMGRSAMTKAAFWTGAKTIFRPVFSLSEFWPDVHATSATVFGYLGSVIHMLLGQPETDADFDNPLRVGFGASASQDMKDEFLRRFGAVLLENYGSTEVGLAGAAMPHELRPGTMGKPPWYIDVEIHDPSDNPVPNGEKGEIVVRPGVPNAIFRGYWGQPEETLEAFRNLWFHSGDAGFLSDDGYVTYTDRIKDSIRRRGENISSFEVERAIQAHPSVAECAAFAVPSEYTEDEVMICVVPSEGETIDPVGLFEFCIETIPRFAVPRYVRVVNDLPKTPSHRVQKYLLKEVGVTDDTADRESLGIVVPHS